MEGSAGAAVALGQELGSCCAGMAWKTAKSRKWETIGKPNGKRAGAGQGAKMAKNWPAKGEKWKLPRKSIFGHFLSLSNSWWEFRPRKKKIAPPPPKKFPADTLPALRSPRRPLSLGLSIKTDPPPLLAPWTAPPLPREEKIKNIRNVHHELNPPKDARFPAPTSPPKKGVITITETAKTVKNRQIWMRLFLLTVGSFLLAVELFYLQLTILVFGLQF